MLNSIGQFLTAGANLPLFMVGLPAVCGLLLWLVRKQYVLQLVTVLLSAAANLIGAFSLSAIGEFQTTLPFAPYGFELSLRVYGLSTLFIAFTAIVFTLLGMFAVVSFRKSQNNGLHLLSLYISLAMVNGALLSDNLGMMLFFWEGLLCTLGGMLLLGNGERPKAAVKALTMVGLADLLLMLGVIVTVHLAGTGIVSQISRLPLSGVGLVGFLVIMAGALGQSGCMPFHSWIPDAADDAPTAFMVAFPSFLAKTLGVYFSARIVLDLYDFVPGSLVSIAMMTLGLLTIILGAASALFQTDLKRSLSYQVVSQVGFVVLGTGSGLPIGIAGGLLHLANQVIGQTGLLMIAGVVERETGTTDLGKLAGLQKRMPAMMIHFAVCALAVVGLPGLGGFLAQRLILEATWASSPVFSVGALIGAFLTALSLLNLWRSIFFGQPGIPEGSDRVTPKLGWSVLLVIPTLGSVLLGLCGNLVLRRLLGPALGMTDGLSGWPHSATLVVTLAIAWLLAVCCHLVGLREPGQFRSALAGGRVYGLVEHGCFDPYNWLMTAVGGFSDVCVSIEHGVSWIYDTAVPGLVMQVGTTLHHFDNGSLSRYLALAVGGTAVIATIFLAVS